MATLTDVRELADELDIGVARSPRDGSRFRIRLFSLRYPALCPGEDFFGRPIPPPDFHQGGHVAQLHTSREAVAWLEGYAAGLDQMATTLRRVAP